jgi:GAF domain-containing protein
VNDDSPVRVNEDLAAAPMDGGRARGRRRQVEVAAALSGAARRDFAEPQVLESLQKLAQLVGPAPALEAWSRAVSRSGLHGMELSAEELLEVAQQLVPGRRSGRRLRTLARHPLPGLQHCDVMEVDVEIPRTEQAAVGELSVADLAALLPAQRAKPDPVRDVARLASIGALDPFGDDVQGLVEDLLDLARAATGADLALLSIVLDDAQLLVGQIGTTGWLAEAAATPIEWSLCALAVADRAPVVLPATTADPRSAENPLVCFDGVASYAGAPLLCGDGAALGALCVMGLEPMDVTAEQVTVLESLAAEAVRRLERRSDARGGAL